MEQLYDGSTYLSSSAPLFFLENVRLNAAGDVSDSALLSDGTIVILFQF